MKPGVYDNITNEDYHGGDGVSKSMLDVLANKSPMHLQFLRSSANDNPPTPAQVLGTAFHALLLEPHEFTKTYTQALRMADVPDAIDDREVLVGMVQELNAKRLPKLPTTGAKADLVARIIAGRAEQGVAVDAALEAQINAMSGADLKQEITDMNASRDGLLPISGSRHDLAELLRANGKPVTLWSDVQAEWHQNNGHRTVLPAEHFDQLRAMLESVMAHPAASALLTGAKGKAEQSVYWIDAITGQLCRCRPDFWREDNIIVDVKTAEDASPEGFAKSIANWRYHVQHAIYVDGVKAATGKEPRFVFLVVEKKPPYAVAVYVLDPESIALGRAEYRRDLQLYAECVRSGQWPGYGEKIQTIGVPQWKLFQNAALLDRVA